jgi:tRNA threonylcarbamoyladenosine biosynthesis protein TsaE
VVCLRGDLGAGKTQLVKGIVEGATSVLAEQVSSPTFVYLNVYPGPRTVYHFDLYRLHDCDEFLSMGFEEYLSAGGICCIEWPERILELLPSGAMQVWLEVRGEAERAIHIEDPSGWLS